MGQVAGKYDNIQRATQKLGTTLQDIHMSLQMLTTPSMPFSVSAKKVFLTLNGTGSLT
jgi:hypothetical protein